jgi:hypothetical protein
MKIRQTALLAAIALSGCATVAPQQASVSEEHFASPVFQARPAGAWGDYTVDFSTGDVTGSVAAAVSAARGLQTGRN